MTEQTKEKYAQDSQALVALAQFCGKKLRAARAFLGWSLDAAQKKTGVHRSTIHSIEVGVSWYRQHVVKLYETYKAHGVEIEPEGLAFRSPDDEGDEE